MSKIKHTNLAVTSASIATGFQASAATAGTSNTTTVPKSGLATSALRDPRATTTSTVPIGTGGGGNLTVVAVNNSETTVA